MKRVRLKDIKPRSDDDDIWTYVLIQRECESGPFWWRLTPDFRLENAAGGGYKMPKGTKILKVQEAEWMRDLDWSGTPLDDPKSDAGWLDRNGKYYGCPSEGHDTCAEYFIKKDVRDLEREGWVRVECAPHCGGKNYHRRDEYFLGQPPFSHRARRNRLSPDQKRWLIDNGYEIQDHDD